MATGNKFDLLDDEVAVKKPNLPLLEEANVSYAMVAEAGATDTSLKRAGKARDSAEAAMISAVVSQVLATIQPGHCAIGDGCRYRSDEHNDERAAETPRESASHGVGVKPRNSSGRD